MVEGNFVLKPSHHALQYFLIPPPPIKSLSTKNNSNDRILRIPFLC
jgi:hypothetical protein